jgi:hypothetical protein
MRTPNPLYELAESIIHMWDYPWFPGRLAYATRFLRWQFNARFGPRVALEGPQKLTVILLSWKRVRNMQPLVRSLLRADFIERIIVSNNNPEYRIRDVIQLRDDRLQLIDQPQARAAGVRFELARNEPGEYFVSIDDDTFLYPEQLKKLFSELIAHPHCPHGRQGEMYVGPPHQPRHPGWKLGLRRLEGNVDVINCVYAFTRGHVEEMYRLAGQLELDIGALANGEDVLLSSSGEEGPMIHDLGELVECLSAHRRGVSTWRTRKNFFAERTTLLLALRAIKKLPAPERMSG